MELDVKDRFAQIIIKIKVNILECDIALRDTRMLQRNLKRAILVQTGSFVSSFGSIVTSCVLAPVTSTV